MADADLYYVVGFGGRVLGCGTVRAGGSSHVSQLAEQHQHHLLREQSVDDLSLPALLMPQDPATVSTYCPGEKYKALKASLERVDSLTRLLLHS